MRCSECVRRENRTSKALGTNPRLRWFSDGCWSDKKQTALAGCPLRPRKADIWREAKRFASFGPARPAIGLTVWTAVSDTQFHRFPKSSVVSLCNDVLALEPGAKFRITADFAAHDAVADREGKCHDPKFSDSNCGYGCHCLTSCYFTRRRS